MIYLKLIGSINLKTGQKKKWEDCKLKGAILRAVHNNHGCATSRQIYEMINTINYYNYNAFRVSLNQYVRRGYLKREGDKKPYHYSLTAKGYRHAKDPFVLKKEGRIRYEKHIAQILGSKKGFKQGVRMFIRQNPERALQEICKSPYLKGNNTFHGYYKNMIDDLQIMITVQQVVMEKQRTTIETQKTDMDQQRIQQGMLCDIFLYFLPKISALSILRADDGQS